MMRFGYCNVYDFGTIGLGGVWVLGHDRLGIDRLGPPLGSVERPAQLLIMNAGIT